MPKEPETYRDNLERVNERFPDRELLTVKEIMQFTGLSRNTVPVVFKFSGKYISKVNFAHMLAKMGA